MKTNVLSTLVMTAVLCGWIASLSAPLAAQAPQASPFKDRAEYDAYNAVVQEKDPGKQAELADKYLAAYPQSKVAESVYTTKLQAYQKQSPPNVQKIEESAAKLLEVNPKQLYALIVLSSLVPQTFNPQDPAADQKLTAAADYAKRGLEAIAALPKPANVSDGDFKKQKDQIESGFHATAGFVGLQKKDFAMAEPELRKSVEENPGDATGFYRLGLADITVAKPPQYEQGIWTLAHALSIKGPGALPDAAQAQVKDYLGKVYQNRHGDAEGLDTVMTQAAAAPFPPQDFHIKTAEEAAPPEPTPAPQPAEAKRELTVKPEDLSDWTAIQKFLQAGGQKADDAWTLLKGQTLPLPGKVVSATPAARPKTIQLAVAPELAAQEGRFDVEVTLAAPSSKPIAKGETIQCEGIVDSYRAKPFLLRLTEAKLTK